jgi:hypothetical protein
MRAGGGKSKGASFERLICVWLSMWMSFGKYEDWYWRSSMSGGRSTVAAAKGKRLAAQAGDISCIHPMGHSLTDAFYIECKSYRDLNFVGLLTGKGKLLEFWREAQKQAKHYGKHPMLIAKQNQQPIIVCLDKAGAAKLKAPARLVGAKWNLRISLFDLFLKTAVRP